MTQVGITGVQYFEPAYVMEVSQTSVPFWQGKQAGYINLHAVNRQAVFAPYGPVSANTFWQDLQQSEALAVHGVAPSAGIYTGVEDICK